MTQTTQMNLNGDIIKLKRSQFIQELTQDLILPLSIPIPKLVQFTKPECQMIFLTSRMERLTWSQKHTFSIRQALLRLIHTLVKIRLEL